MKKKMFTICTVLLFLAALCLTLYPLISNYVNQKYASQIHTAYQEVMEQIDDSALREAKEQAEIYNHSLIPGASTQDTYSQEGLQAASANYDSQLNLAGNGIMGYVEIPKISVNLPIIPRNGKRFSGTWHRASAGQLPPGRRRKHPQHSLWAQRNGKPKDVHRSGTVNHWGCVLSPCSG